MRRQRPRRLVGKIYAEIRREIRAMAATMPDNIGGPPLKRGERRHATERRLEVVEDLLSLGWDRRMIAAELCPAWSIDRRTSNRYVDQVHERWAKDEAVNATNKRHHLELTLHTVLRAAMEEGEHAAAIRSVRELGLLNGLYRPEVEIPKGAGVGVAIYLPQVRDPATVTAAPLAPAQLEGQVVEAEVVQDLPPPVPAPSEDDLDMEEPDAGYREDEDFDA